MINRVWKGWTSPANADAYEALLLTEIFPRIAARRIPGFLGIRCDRLDGDAEVEFVTSMLFESIDAVIAFAGSTE